MVLIYRNIGSSDEVVVVCRNVGDKTLVCVVLFYDYANRVS